MKARFTLSATERLKSRKSIDALFAGGHAVTVFPFRIFYQFTKTGLRFGAAVSKKNFKRAVDRNRVKRLTREVYRQEKLALQSLLEKQGAGMDLFFIYTQKESPEYKQLLVKMKMAIKKMMEIAHENNPPAA